MAYTRTGYANFAAFPATGSTNIIYVDLSNGNEYLWSGTVYVAYTGTQAGVRQGYQDIAWFNANPGFLLGRGQRVNLLQTGQYKLGDGVTALSALALLGGSATPAIQAVLAAGNVATTTIETTGFIKTGGTAAQFLKADGSVDSSTYITSVALAPYFLTSSFTDSAVTSKLITGYASGAGVVAATDTILQAINKLNGNIGALVTGVSSVNSLTGSVALTGTVNRLTVSAANIFDISATFEALLGKVASPLSQFAATTSAQLAGVISDETGSGALVFGTSPTFTTDITTPLIIGGTAVGSVIQYKGTSGNGTSTVAAHQFLVGNNGATAAVTMYNSGNIQVGALSQLNTGSLGLFRVRQGGSNFDTGELASNVPAIWLNSAANIPTTSNYVLKVFSGVNAVLNAPTTAGGIFFNIGDTYTPLTLYGNKTSGALISCEFVMPTMTGQTASTNIPNFKVTGATKTWANAGGTNTLSNQNFNWFSANSMAISGGGTFTVAALNNLLVEAPTVTSGTATNIYAINCGGHLFISNSVGVPSNNPTGGGILYVESGALKYRGSSGTVTPLALA